MSYHPTLGRWLERDPAGYVDGADLYQYVRGNPVGLTDPMGLATEAELWETQRKRAEDALNFWRDFLNLRMGNNPNGGPITGECLNKLIDVIRAISWVESQHGTGTGHEPARDPMQSGNPDDMWWKGIQGQGKQDRIVGGPGKGNWDLRQLPGVTKHPAPPKGHDDPSFTPDISYFWGVLALIHKSNNGAKGGGRTYRCGDCSWDQFIDGATAYNGGGDPKYRQKILDALKQIGSGPQ
jgi:hypothetical protein